METNESVEALPSEDNGNVPAEAPSVETKPEAPVEAPVEPTVTEPELYELPDGRKVDAETLSKEWKENFYPDYTRKSQELAKVKTPELQDTKTANPYASPDYVPQSYAELIEVAKAEALKAIENKEQERINHQQAIETKVANELSEVKKLDGTVNENALFQHALKYGFQNLKQAHQNMKDMSDLAKKVQTTTAQNIAKRSDPVSASPGATGQRPDPSGFSTARDYLRSITN